MGFNELQRCAAARADELPGAAHEHPFGPDSDVYKVRGRMFMLMHELESVPIVTLKVRPFDSEALREAYPEISPGYHMNKRHWITLRPGTMADRDLVEDLVTESYLLVVEKLPRSRRPFDISTFGR